MAKISVIVPVYKVEKYLSRCVDSILAQTFSDYELILVDDGSPDNCPAICDEYAIMNLVGVKRTEQELVHEGKRSFDVLTIDENEYGLEKLYYDVSVMMDYLDKVLK